MNADFHDVWPPRFVEIVDDWILRPNQLAYTGYKETYVRRLSFPTLEPLEPLPKEVAAKLGLLPKT